MACVVDSAAQERLVAEQLPEGFLKDAASEPSTEFGSEEGSERGEVDSSDCDDCGSLTTFGAEDTILILDWDDTVLPTTWIQEQGLRIDDPLAMPSAAQAGLLRAVALRAAETLRVAKAHGTVVLVTNAERGWVELSCQEYMPSLLPSLEGVKILSARFAYEWRGVQRPSEWKYLAFHSEISEFCGADRKYNVISIGDSPHEREALIRVTDRIPNSSVKALKLTERPKIEQLLEEHELIIECLSDIVAHDGCLDLAIRFA